MKFLKNENCKLEPVTKYVCIFTTIFYSTMLLLVGLLYFSALLPLESQVYIEDFVNVVFVIVMLVTFLQQYINIGFVLPIIITVFLVIVSFIRFIKRKNPRVFVHPLVLSSIITSFVGTGFIMCFVERIENGF